MHDTNIINIPFQTPYVRHLGGVEFGLCADLQYFGVKSYGGIRFDVDTGRVEYYDIKHPFEKLPSSFSDMAVKVYHHTKNTIPYIALNASPKFLQGHNVYGTDYVYELVCEMLGVLRDSYPVLWSFLDVQDAHFARIDVTYSARLPTDDMMFEVIDMIGRVKTKYRFPDNKRNIFANTRYWGQAVNRVGYCKMYGKNNEVADTMKSLRRKARADNRQAHYLLDTVFTPELEQFAKNLIRFEATNKKQMLENMGIPSNIWQFMLYQKNNPDCMFKMWKFWFSEIFDSMRGEVSMNLDDNYILDLCKKKLTVYKMNIRQELKRLKFNRLKFPFSCKCYHLINLKNYNFTLAYKSETKALNAYRFYCFLREKGYQHAKEVTNKATFNRTVKLLTDVGVSKAELQSLNGREIKTVPLVELIQIDFANQTPPNYQPVKSRYSGDFDEYLNPLRLVA